MEQWNVFNTPVGFNFSNTNHNVSHVAVTNLPIANDSNEGLPNWLYWILFIALIGGVGFLIKLVADDEKQRKIEIAQKHEADELKKKNEVAKKTDSVNDFLAQVSQING